MYYTNVAQRAILAHMLSTAFQRYSASYFRMLPVAIHVHHLAAIRLLMQSLMRPYVLQRVLLSLVKAKLVQNITLFSVHSLPWAVKFPTEKECPF
jgi:hypothetical protein